MKNGEKVRKIKKKEIKNEKEPEKKYLRCKKV